MYTLIQNKLQVVMRHAFIYVMPILQYTL